MRRQLHSDELYGLNLVKLPTDSPFISLVQIIMTRENAISFLNIPTTIYPQLKIVDVSIQTGEICTDIHDVSTVIVIGGCTEVVIDDDLSSSSSMPIDEDISTTSSDTTEWITSSSTSSSSMSIDEDIPSPSIYHPCTPP